MMCSQVGPATVAVGGCTGPTSGTNHIFRRLEMHDLSWEGRGREMNMVKFIEKEGKSLKGELVGPNKDYRPSLREQINK